MAKEAELRQFETLSGQNLKLSYSPQLIADFDYIYPETAHRTWKGIYEKDLLIKKKFDFFGDLVNRVKNFNESHDITIVGDRGIGKSAAGLSAAIIIHRLFTGNPDAIFPMNQVCFTIQDWMEAIDKMTHGGVVVLDEVGRKISVLLRTSMSKENRSIVDVVQLMRTTNIITIYISVDRDRIDKRVRQITNVMMTPVRKLTHEETGCGLAIALDVRLQHTYPSDNPNNDTDYLKHKVSQLHYAPKGIISNIIVPHPTIDRWLLYGEKREQKLEEIREKAAQAYANDEEIEFIQKEAVPIKNEIKPVEKIEVTEKKERSFFDRLKDHNSIL